MVTDGAIAESSSPSDRRTVARLLRIELRNPFELRRRQPISAHRRFPATHETEN
jgi:hypothetical protein